MRPPKDRQAESRSPAVNARRRARRADILEAALEVLRERGLADTSMLDIAQRAGVSSGTMYQYFEDRADVFRWLLQSLLDVLYDETRLPVGADGRLIIGPSVLRYLTIYRRYSPIYRAWWERIEPPTEFTGVWLELHQTSRAQLEKVVQRGQRDKLIYPDYDPALVSDLVMAMFDRSPLRRVVLCWEDELTDETMATTMSRLLDQGLIGEARQDATGKR